MRLFLCLLGRECRSVHMARCCYRHQLELINEEYRLALEQTPSRRSTRKAMDILKRYAGSQGVDSVSLAFGSHDHGEVKFTSGQSNI